MTTYNLEAHRHTMAHILAQAVLRLYPDAKLGIGPVVDNGFYQEFELSNNFMPEDLAKIEQEMWSIVKEDFPLTQIYLSKDEAYNLLLHQGQIYKTEVLEEINQDEVSMFKTGEEFIDLCSGPHVGSTGEVGNFKLTRIEEGYWKGLPSRPKLKKIYGVGFLDKKDLAEFLENESKKKELDHRKLGQELEFYHISKDTGAGLPLWLPKGSILRNIIFDFIQKEKEKDGFKEVFTPSLIPSSSSLLSSVSEEHAAQFFPEIKNSSERLLLRVDKSPLHYQIYKARVRSYRDLPVKIYEHGFMFRDEDEHSLHGLTKTRVFTGETNHIFCSEDQLFKELLSQFNLIVRVLHKFDIRDYKVQFSTNYKNKDNRFKWAESVLLKVIETLKLNTRQVDDPATTNGPKIEFFIKDIFDKEWQLSTMQLDIFSTIKQGLTFINKNGKQKEVLVIRTTTIGSIERLIGLLLERTNGSLPLWLAPEQVRILPISRKYNIFAEGVLDQIQRQGVRADIDTNDETLQMKIRKSEEDRVPFMLVIGSKEESSRSVSVRPREGQDMGLMKIEEFVDYINNHL